MPEPGPIKQKELIRLLKKLGFNGPFCGGKHQMMNRLNLTIHVPNPHHNDISKGLLLKILKQAQIDPDIWRKL